MFVKMYYNFNKYVLECFVSVVFYLSLYNFFFCTFSTYILINKYFFLYVFFLSYYVVSHCTFIRAEEGWELYLPRFVTAFAFVSLIYIETGNKNISANIKLFLIRMDAVTLRRLRATQIAFKKHSLLYIYNQSYYVAETINIVKNKL